MDKRLNIKDEFEARKFLIVSIIRLMGMDSFSMNSLSMMAYTSTQLYRMEQNHGSISDEDLFKLYVENLEGIRNKEAEKYEII